MSPSVPSPRTSLDDLPTDILITIASDLACLHPRGPPSAVYGSLLQTNSTIAATDSPHLAGLVFRAQFDVDAIKRRLLSHLTPTILQFELRRRWRSLKRIRWAASAGTSAVWGKIYHPTSILEDMWVAFVMLTEDDGKNWEQLVGWAMLPAYIHAYVQWDLLPASDGVEVPVETEMRCLGMWLVLFLSDDRNPTREIDRHLKLMRLLKPAAFASFVYPAQHLPWHLFPITPEDASLVLLPPPPRPLTPSPSFARLSAFNSYLNSPLNISPPLISEAAIQLTFIKAVPGPTFGSNVPSSPAASDSGVSTWNSSQYDSEWSRLVSLCPSPSFSEQPRLGFKYIPGSFSGVFEGNFILPGFDAHEKIMAGESLLSTFDSTMFIAHVQAWRLDEHVFDRKSPGTVVEVNRPGSMVPRRVKCSGPLSPGPALSAHLPDPFVVEKVHGGILTSGVQGSALYRTWHGKPQTYTSDDSGEVTMEPENKVESDGFIDIIVTGEAIEPLGGLRTSSLMNPGSTVHGTVRRKDGLITLVATPILDEAGEWIYIGRLCADGTWIGKWRARQDDATTIVQEGIFRMRRR